MSINRMDRTVAPGPGLARDTDQVLAGFGAGQVRAVAASPPAPAAHSWRYSQFDPSANAPRTLRNLLQIQRL